MTARIQSATQAGIVACLFATSIGATAAVYWWLFTNFDGWDIVVIHMTAGLAAGVLVGAVNPKVTRPQRRLTVVKNRHGTEHTGPVSPPIA